MYKEPIYTVQPAFSHGEVSPFIFGRTDLAAYQSGLRTSRNGFIRTEGSWSNRQGLEYCAPSTTYTAYASVLIPFTFNVGQSYVIEFGYSSVTNTGTIQVFAQGVALSSFFGTTPYQQADLALLRYSQSADTLTIVHPNYQPYEFKRTSATTFTFLAAVYTMGPFLQQNSDGVTFVYASAASGTVTLTASAPIFNANHVGALFQLEQQDLSQIPPWEPEKVFTNAAGADVTPIGQYRRSNLKNYKCVATVNNSAASFCTGTVAPDHNQGTENDGDGSSIPNLAVVAGLSWQYQDSGYGIVLITGFTSSTVVTGIVQPNYTGGPGLLPLPCVGGPVAAVVGPWSFTGDGTTTSFSLGTSTTTNPNLFLVTFSVTTTVTATGVATTVTTYQAPSLYTVNGTNIVFVSPPAGVTSAGATTSTAAAIAVEQIASLGQTTYWAFGAFSPDQGYPSTVSYFPDRLVLAATPQQPVGVFASQTSNYHNFGVSNPVVASDAFTVFLNARQLNKISDIVPLQDLIIGTANIIWRLWPGNGGGALGPLAIEATPQAFLGESPGVAAVLYGDSMLYSIYGGRRIRDLVYQFQFDKYVGAELTAYSRHLIPYGVQIIKMCYAPDPWGQVYVLRSDGILLTCTYVREQQMIAWSRWDTQGTIEDIALVPENNSYSLYVVTNRTIQGSTVRYIERLSQWETDTIYDYQFMDCSLTYDGRNTSATGMTLTGGTTWLAGDVGQLSANSLTGWANFAATDPNNGNIIQLFDANGNLARVIITAYLNASNVKVRFADPIPVSLQATVTTTWTFARKYFTGCNQLAGQTVSALVDGNCIAGLNGAPTLVIGNDGSFTLPTPGGVVCVGLQYFSDMETLALNQQGVETIRHRAKAVPHIYLDVTGGRGLIAGSDFDTMFPIKERAFESYLSTTDLQEGIIHTLIQSEFDAEAHVCVRQPWPLPVTIRMVIPAIDVGAPIG